MLYTHNMGIQAYPAGTRPIYKLYILCEQSTVLLACYVSRKGSNSTSWLLSIAIISSVPYRVATIQSSKCKIIKKADYRSANINRHLELLGIREIFSLKNNVLYGTQL